MKQAMSVDFKEIVGRQKLTKRRTLVTVHI